MLLSAIHRPDRLGAGAYGAGGGGTAIPAETAAAEICREVMSVPKEDWGFLNEKAFEAALQASVPERLPDKVAAAVTP